MEFLAKYAESIIALCALFFTAWSFYVQRRHNKLSVKPHLTGFVTTEQNGTVGMAKLEIMNNGLGPAFIKSFEIFLNGEPCNYDAALNFVTKGLSCKWQRTHMGEGYAMRSGEIKDVFSVNFPCSNNDELELIKNKFNSLDLEIKYTCAYGSVKQYSTFKKSG